MYHHSILLFNVIFLFVMDILSSCFVYRFVQETHPQHLPTLVLNEYVMFIVTFSMVSQSREDHRPINRDKENIKTFFKKHQNKKSDSNGHLLIIHIHSMLFKINT